MVIQKKVNVQILTSQNGVLCWDGENRCSFIDPENDRCTLCNEELLPYQETYSPVDGTLEFVIYRRHPLCHKLFADGEVVE